ncbi:MAG TPA: hypothetical protein VIV66_02105, partial [Pyrinomonadaceae bacterium]
LKVASIVAPNRSRQKNYQTRIADRQLPNERQMGVGIARQQSTNDIWNSENFDGHKLDEKWETVNRD